MSERQEGSGHVSFKAYGVKPLCSGCGRKITLAESLWFRGGRDPAVYGRECWPVAAAAKAS